MSFILILKGCQFDKKQASKIYKIMAKSAEFEKKFAATQLELYETRKNAQALYNELINLTINDKDIINQKVEEGFTFIKEQQQLVKEAEENFTKAYHTLSKIKKNINKIQDEDQKNQATNLVTIMDERKKRIDSFFEDYNESLELQNTFYQQFEDDKIRIDSLTQQINDINIRTQDMGEAIKEFNRYSEQYFEVEKEFMK